MVMNENVIINEDTFGRVHETSAEDEINTCGLLTE